MKRLDINQKIDIPKIYYLAKNFPGILNKEKIKYQNAFSEPKNIMSANFGLFSGFASKVDYYSEKFNLDDIEAF